MFTYVVWPMWSWKKFCPKFLSLFKWLVSGVDIGTYSGQKILLNCHLVHEGDEGPHDVGVAAVHQGEELVVHPAPALLAGGLEGRLAINRDSNYSVDSTLP